MPLHHNTATNYSTEDRAGFKAATIHYKYNADLNQPERNVTNNARFCQISWDGGKGTK